MLAELSQLDRREFLCSLLRYSSVAGVLGLVGMLGTRRPDPSLPAAHDDPGLCQSCRVLYRCERPAAQTARAQSDAVKEGGSG